MTNNEIAWPSEIFDVLRRQEIDLVCHVPDAGHAPFLNTREQISEISAFLADRSC